MLGTGADTEPRTPNLPYLYIIRRLVLTVEGMFEGAHSFNQPLNNWNVSNVTHMNRMFWAAKSFRVGLERVRNGPSVGGSFAARWARMVLKRCSSERGER